MLRRKVTACIDRLTLSVEQTGSQNEYGRGIKRRSRRRRRI
jgi:hypothetical protein